jgi:FixJ family two-component response regulator
MQRVVWIIDADHWPRACLRAELIERGFDAVGFVKAADALAALALRPQRPPALAIVDLRGQPLTRERLAPLLRGGFPVVAVGGAAEWGMESVRQLPWSASLRRPLTIGAIADEIARLLARRGR